MSFYSSGQVKSEIVEPSIDSSRNRSEFRLPKGDLLPNLKLCNVGLAGSASVPYNPAVGGLSSIKNLYLYDGKVELQSVRSFNDYKAFHNLRNDNRNNSEVRRYTEKTQIGYANRYDLANKEQRVVVKDPIVVGFSGTDVPAGSGKAFLDLSECMNFLKGIPVLSSSVFKNLRLVVEYESDNRKMITADNKDATVAAVGTTRPLLVVDRVEDESVAASLRARMANFQFMVHERDRIPVKAVTAGASVTTARRILGFNNKNVQRIAIRKSFNNPASNFAGNAVQGYGPYNSVNGLSERYQVVLNGRSLFPRDGLPGDNRALAHLNDTYGSFNIPDSANSNYNVTDIAAYTLPSLAGNLDFFGTFIGEQVQDLRIEYSRTGHATDASTVKRYNDALDLHVEAEVVKQISFGNGGYLVSY
jgi:hypothetical protein